MQNGQTIIAASQQLALSYRTFCSLLHTEAASKALGKYPRSLPGYNTVNPVHKRDLRSDT
jgi:hypothetical protein